MDYMTNGQRPTDCTTEPPDDHPIPWSDAHAAAVIEGVITSAEPALTDAECARLGAVITYLTAADPIEIQPPESGPSPYPTGSAASHAYAAGDQAGTAADLLTDGTTARELALLGAEAQAIAERLGGEQ